MDTLHKGQNDDNNNNNKNDKEYKSNVLCSTYKYILHFRAILNNDLQLM
jgi:hypothetical protein